MNRKKCLEQIGIGLTLILGLLWIYYIIVKDVEFINPFFKTGGAFIVYYVLGPILFIKVVEKCPSKKINHGVVDSDIVAFSFFIQFTISIVVGTFFSFLGIKTGEIGTITVLSIIEIVLLTPIFEEFVFRKILAEKLMCYGESVYIVISSLLFAIAHIQSLGGSQVISSFLTGMIFSYLVVKTGSIKWPIIIHSFSNLFIGIIPTIVISSSETMQMMYSIFMICMATAGGLLLISKKEELFKNKRNIILDVVMFKEFIFNKGIIMYFFITILMYITM